MADQIGDFFPVNPACHQDKIVFGVDPQDAGAGAYGGIAGLRRCGPFTPSGIEPPEQPVSGIDGAWFAQGVGPAFGQTAPAFPDPVLMNQQAEAGVIEAVDMQAAAPVGAAGHRMHAVSADLHIRIAVSVPGPGLRCADRIHDTCFQDFRQGFLKGVKQRERQKVDPYIIVFPEGPRQLEVAVLTLAAVIRTGTDLPVAVDQVRFVP